MRRHRGTRVGWVAAVLIGSAGSATLAAAQPPGAAPTHDPRLAPLPALPTVVLTGTPTAPVRTEPGGMLAVAPLDHVPLHLLAGSRPFGRVGTSRGAGRDGLLAVPRGAGARYGRRVSPALLVGLGESAEQGLSIGADAGVMMGRMTGEPYRLGRMGMRIGGGSGRRDGLNPVARATMSYRF